MISILTAFTSDDPSRNRIWEWVKLYYQVNFPGAEHIVGENHDIPFNKSAAVNEAARKASGDVFLLADADTCLDAVGCCLAAARLRCRPEGEKWAYPVSEVFRLSGRQTNNYLNKFPPSPIGRLEKTACRWHSTLMTKLAGWPMVTREAWEDLGGMDERFNEGWGCEDACFGLALRTLHGPPAIVIDSRAVHLQHHALPGPEGTFRWRGQERDYANKDLTARYCSAVGNLEAMRALITEKGYNKE